MRAGPGVVRRGRAEGFVAGMEPRGKSRKRCRLWRQLRCRAGTRPKLASCNGRTVARRRDALQGRCAAVLLKQVPRLDFRRYSPQGDIYGDLSNRLRWRWGDVAPCAASPDQDRPSAVWRTCANPRSPIFVHAVGTAVMYPRQYIGPCWGQWLV